ncbi:MAG TPA: alpha/beta fold hydrolase [Thermoanaerobaculia bacterium]|nr:alpha/beta fold hydrolase [Thermoanaerobaculia bacterium]
MQNAVRPSPPPRPSGLYEALSWRWFHTFAPRLPRIEAPDPPARLAPWRTVAIPRRGRRGTLAGTWYPLRGERSERGAVLLMPPYLEWGRSYFHRRRRIESLRQAGYQVLAVDFPGFGGSAPPQGFFDREVAAALSDLAQRAPAVPLFVWGVSAGGYWSHPALSDGAVEPAVRQRVRAAFFEDVSPHLLEWAERQAPAGRPLYRLFRLLFPAAYRYLDLRHHAPALGLPVVYVSGADDPGVPPEETRALADRAGGEAEIVDGAGHLEAIKRETRRVIARALAVFAGA